MFKPIRLLHPPTTRKSLPTANFRQNNAALLS